MTENLKERLIELARQRIEDRAPEDPGLHAILAGYVDHLSGYGDEHWLAPDVLVAIESAVEDDIYIAKLLDDQVEDAIMIPDALTPAILAAWAAGSASLPLEPSPALARRLRPLQDLVAEAKEVDLPDYRALAVSDMTLRYDDVGKKLDPTIRAVIDILKREHADVARYFADLDEHYRQSKEPPPPEMQAAWDRVRKLPSDQRLAALIADPDAWGK